MSHSQEYILKFCILITCFILLYLTLRELKVALGVTQVSAETTPCSTPTPTPTSPPSATPSAAPTPTPSPIPNNTIFITEFMACPASGNEWIELFNASSSTIDVTNWQIIDAANNKKTLAGSIPAQSYKTFEWTGSLLNNTGDSFKLITTTGQVLAEAAYESCTTGISFVYEDGEWIGALESPNEPTEVSEETITGATLSAQLADTYFLQSLLPDSTKVLGYSDTTLAPSQIPLPELTLSTNTHSSPATQNEEIPHSSIPLASVISVIMGGLLQIVPGSIALYDTYFKSSS